MKQSRVAFLIIIALLIFSVQQVGAISLEISEDGLVTSPQISKGDADSAWNDFLLEYKNFVLGFFGVATVSTVLLFIVSFLKLGASAGNPSERAKAIRGVLWTGIATALLGGTLFFFTMFYSIFK